MLNNLKLKILHFTKQLKFATQSMLKAVGFATFFQKFKCGWCMEHVEIDHACIPRC